MKILLTALFLIALSLDDTKATSDSSVRGANPENPSSEETLHPLELDSSCPVFTRNPHGNAALTQQMLDSTLPCGTYESRGCTHEVIPANVDFPGEGPGDLEFKPYIVQFDIGVHNSIKAIVEQTADQGQPCIGCSAGGGEQCLELIVKGNSDVSGGCAGKCGGGCVIGAGWAKDCMKHDVCTAYKDLVLGGNAWNDDDGFCYDIDCGDEAAQTVMNCYIDNWSADTPITCEKSNFSNRNAYGAWSYVTSYFTEGPCGNFVNWNSGQGLPDVDKIHNPYQFLSPAERMALEDVSHVE